jgi:hypothetical protein
MKLSEFKNKLEQIENLTIQLPNGTTIPAHFHITEMGLLTKNYIDCGNTIREEKLITFQVWFAGDLEHRLVPSKVYKIIDASKKLIGDQDLELEVEYQTESTIGKFGLDFNNGKFFLTPKETTCLANDHCGISDDKMKVKIGEWKEKVSCCTPNSGCC